METPYVHPPKTMMEMFQGLPEGTLAQLINNQIFMSPSPSNSHQKILMKISAQFFDFVETNDLGEVRVALFDVFLNNKNAFQPDIIFIAKDNLPHLKESGFYSAPDIFIEILSPATRRFDEGDKKNAYERSGVNEYWMIDPGSRNAEGFYLAENKFRPLPPANGIILFKTINLEIKF